MHENVSGTWKRFTDAKENVSGTWKRLLEGYENVGGVWKKCWSAFVPNLPANGTVVANDSSAVGTGEVNSIIIGSNGNLSYGNLDGLNTVAWGTPSGIAGIAGGFWVRLTVNTGSAPDSGSAGVWTSTNSDVTWQWNTNGSQTKSSSGVIEVASDSGGANILDSTTYSVDLNDFA